MVSTTDSIPTAATGEPRMRRLLGLGLVAAAFFSVTFVLNRAMSLEGGHWVWSASLRYLDMAILLSAFLLIRRGPGYLAEVLRLFGRRLRFWLVAGGIGFGVFYAACCFAADHAPGWIIAATWQVTILATPLVLRAFGERVPLRGIVFLVVIFAGIVVINLNQILHGAGPHEIIAGVLPMLVAAVAYPTGNQLLNRAKHAGGTDGALLADPVAAVLLLTLGSLPFFAVLVGVTLPPPPSTGQIASTAVIALVAGGLATTLFLYARNLSRDPYRIAAVDATQSGEVGFALLGEMLWLGVPAPNLLGWLGLAAVMGGLVGFTLKSRG
jgi:drug/metabolite transporter (DMT)-like permease